MKNPSLSIIITCYNLGEYLEEAIASIKEYSMNEDYEVILVNDGSTNATTNAILEEVVKSDKAIIYINQSNLGLAKARNNGIKQAKGKYIIPLDADNKLRPEFIEQTISILNNNLEIDVVHGNAQNFGNKVSIWKSKPFNFPEMLLNNYIDACAGFRKSTWEKLGGYDETMPVMGFEDWDLWLRMGNAGCRFEYVDELFFDYRVRDNSMLSEAWQKRSKLLDYIFNKKELKHLALFRESVIENKKLKEEPSFNLLITTILKKVKRKLPF
ncbi:N-terminal domain of galactosyltransferase [Flavobacterium omnivorum]|uniref:N-terminal domain of galactosyltransferase n=1 Tax=Flavobacterium omnivorum TaxID=178355 RepID=A0A1G8CA83_9FLAO|nr:glycosyltransferase family A protein [Flavobacterium omnivorum]SDH42229.1 N-terminal domain of galactosyltransferase [Flavobacterium omnivorum]